MNQLRIIAQVCDFNRRVYAVYKSLSDAVRTGSHGVWCFPLSKLGIEKTNNNENNIVVYPNPAADKITIKIAEGQVPSQLSMMNINGEEVLTRSLIKPKTQIDISNFPCGVYFVRVTNDKTVEVGKFVKQ
ncbi:MAG: T9SS type A sorting domain-containing protein [Bacteroidales bacterium]